MPAREEQHVALDRSHAAQHAGGGVVIHAMATGKTIRQLVIEKGIFTEDELSQILDPHELTKPGVAGDFRFEPRMPEGYERPTQATGETRR